MQELLPPQNLPTDYIDIPFTAFLIVAGKRKVLMDTGFSDNGSLTTGHLMSNLNAAGYKAEDIDAVILSDYHGDHILGVRNKAGQLVYPNAKIMVQSVKHAFWMDDARMAAAPDAINGAFQTVRRMLGGLGDDKLVKFEAGTEVVPGVKSVAAYGHTPGHTLFMVESKGEKFAYLADITNVPKLFARNPDWAVQFDMDAEAVRLTRRKVFDMIANDRVMAGGFHVPFPAFGRVEKLGNGFEFKPVA